MKNLYERFADLKVRIGGNHEKTKYESTYGTPDNELTFTTGVNEWIIRVISETDFALQLNREKQDRFGGEVDRALSVLEEGMETDGTLTKSVCAAAEEALLPLADAAREYHVICASHAHIDMNWMWSMQETVAITLATFRTVLSLMEQYPGFTYTQSQASVYKIVEDYDPAMMECIRERVREGRWEVAATAWVETDKNMPDTESLLRQVLCTRDYLCDTLGIDPKSLEVDFSPDTFGHSRHLPELDSFADVRYYYHCRGRDEKDILYRWRSPSGKELLTYREPFWYNSGINPDIGTSVFEVSRRSGGLKTSLIVYGVGDHGGGPTRRDIERIYAMMNWPVFPAVRFGTVREYFHIAESVRDNLPVETEELNFVFDGCYSTQSRIKAGNRRAEAALLEAEAMNALVPGAQYPRDRFTRAWRCVLFTHFHDILTGSCVQDSREYAMGLYADAMSVAGTCRSLAMEKLSAQTDTGMFAVDSNIAEERSEGAGAGYGITRAPGVPNPERGAGKSRIYTVFNPSAEKRTGNVEITLWDWMRDPNLLAAYDAEGNLLETQLMDTRQKKYWDHHYIRVLVRVEVPAMGYTSFMITRRERTEYPTFLQDSVRKDHPFDPILLENRFLKAAFDPGTGLLVSLIDKATGRECIRPGCQAGLVWIDTEEKSSDAWHIGRYIKDTQVGNAVSLQRQNGAISCGFTAEYGMMESTVRSTVSLGKDDAFLSFAFEIDWNEYAKEKRNVPVLVYKIPLNGIPDTYRMDVPSGIADRGPQNMDMPALSYTAAVYGARALQLTADVKYGYRAQDEDLAVTLINTAKYPDPYPERGRQTVHAAVGVSPSGAKKLKENAFAFCHPLLYCSSGSHNGSLSPTGQLLDFHSETCVLSAVGLTKKGYIFVRLFETEGKAGHATITLPSPIASACLCNLSGDRWDRPVGIDGRSVSFDVPPYALAQVEMEIG